MTGACTVCGDPTAYLGSFSGPCPSEPERASGICAEQTGRAERESLWRRMAPEAFDRNGVIKPDGLAIVLEKIAQKDAGQ